MYLYKIINNNNTNYSYLGLGFRIYIYTKKLVYDSLKEISQNSSFK